MVVITGASSGIGRCTGALFSCKRWQMDLIARGGSGLDALRHELAAVSGRALAIIADVQDSGALVLQPGLSVMPIWRCGGMTSEREVRGWVTGLDGVVDRIEPRFGRAEPRRRAASYLRGLLASVERKNGWQLAEAAGDATPGGM